MSFCLLLVLLQLLYQLLLHGMCFFLWRARLKKAGGGRRT
uniref:Uncharacterized protein n=1 Tax=Arundo donax TaxID=35708 RepID=A0A0A8ZFW4_ARUDO